MADSIQESMTVGWIPANWDHSEKRISCGDSDESGTSEFEVYIETEDNGESSESSIYVRGLDEKYYPNTKTDWWNNSSKIWKAIAEETKRIGGENGQKITGSQLAGCWRLFKQESEGEEELGLEVVASGSDCGGEFHNNNNIFNGRFYVRYMIAINGEYQDDDEMIVVINI